MNKVLSHPRYLLIYFLAGLLISDCSVREEATKELAPIDFEMFEKINADKSGIRFKNSLKEDFEKGNSRFAFDYFYNGAGVGVADLNNDGLQDIFFTGNQVNNRLYINQGELQFKDVSASANINQNKGWATGVTFADINRDGWLDIYVSQGGPLAYDRSNRLYINQGLASTSQGGPSGVSFTEEAAKYGLDYKGITTQSVFFDYDKDGDLDCLVMNEHPLYGYSAREFQYYLKKEPDLLHASSCHLFKFENNRFINVTEQAGLLTPAFGLGVVVSDINKDNWLDFYISNDYYIPDALYINQRNGTFKDEVKQRTNQVAYAGMGADIADLNNDGNYDIFTVDMASPDHVRAKILMEPMNIKLFDYLVNEMDYQHAYMFNTLQLGVGNGTFQNIPHLTGLAKTEWSWAALMADLDNDADKDILVSNGTEFTLDNDFHAKVQAVYAKYPAPNPIPVAELKKLHSDIPKQMIPNLLFENQGGLTFKNVALSWGFKEPSFSNGAVYADLDKDGDLDILINNNNQEASLYRNLVKEKTGRNYLRVKATGNLSESFPKVWLRNDGKEQTIEISRVRGYLSAVENIAHFGLGNNTRVDTVAVLWPSGRYEERYQIKANQTLDFFENEARSQQQKRPENDRFFKPIKTQEVSLTYMHTENNYDDFAKETLLPYKQSTLGPFMATGDLNGDGNDDLFVGGASGQAGHLFVQSQDGFKEIASPALEKDRMAEDMGAIFLDIDEDQDNDILIVSGGNEHENQSGNYLDRLYLNDGNGNLTRADHVFKDSFKYSGKSVAGLDYDLDGDLDIVIGNRMMPGKYPTFHPSLMYQNDQGKLRNVTDQVAPDLATFGAINKIIPTDFDQDGWTDLIAVGEWTHIGLLKNENGVFRDISHNSSLDLEKGWWFNVAETDINNDQLPDYVVGNLGLNSKFKATPEKPFKVFAGDFDHNGSHDMMLSYQYKNEYVPLRGRECSSGQLPFIIEKFPTYQSFAHATMVDLFGEQLQESYEREATEFRSIILLNKGEGRFEKIPLPEEAQIFPVLACEFLDINNDGFEDAILAGGIYNTEVETPRLDAGVGLLLMSDGSANYRPISWDRSGLYIPGDVKSMEKMVHKGLKKTLLLVGRNNERLEVIEVNDKK